MKIISLTILTAIFGILISGFVPRLGTSNQPTSPPSPTAVETQNFASLHEKITPSISPTPHPDAAKARDYQKKVDLLLSYLDKNSKYKTAGSTLGDYTTATDSLFATPTPSFLLADPALPTTILPPSTYIRPEAQNLGVLATNPQDSVIRIAILGDSMVDTLGKDLVDLRKLLESKYPDKTFALFNHGQGATNMDQGCVRLTETTTYLQTDYPPLLSYQPNILVIESFAYNHWSSASHDLDRQWITLARCLDTVRKQSPKTQVILSTTIGPDPKTIGDGKLNWPTAVKAEWSATTKAYLQNMIRFASSEKYPLADAYTPSLDTTGNGKAIYINQTDHLHPSEQGKKLFSQKIIDTIGANKLIQ